MVSFIHQTGLTCNKAWLISGLRLGKGGVGLTPEINGERLQRGDWNAHVAPFVTVELTSAVFENWVLDPVVSRKAPLEITDWKDRMQDRECHMFYTGPHIYHLGWSLQKGEPKLVEEGHRYDYTLSKSVGGLRKLASGE